VLKAILRVYAYLIRNVLVSLDRFDETEEHQQTAKVEEVLNVR
jgi:hypothetical protein